MIASKDQHDQKKLSAIRSAVGSSLSSPQRSITKNEAPNDEALAKDIQKLMNPNKDRLEKIKLEHRFLEIMSSMKQTASSTEHLMNQTLQSFKSQMESSQKEHLAIMRSENKEMKQYIQHLHNDLDQVNFNSQKKMKNF